MWIKGKLSKGHTQFQIDHPLDPANKYLVHGAVESDEMKNMYDGIVELDKHGQAEVTLPAWFEALNEQFRYQLTAIGPAAPELRIARELADGRFTIAGGEPGAKVSWLVTGVRRDAYAKANPMHVEVDKDTSEQGRFLHPESHGEPPEKALYGQSGPSYKKS
jgi:hypothetical protein